MSVESSIEKELEKYGKCIFNTSGNSMEPLLREKCTHVLIEKCSCIHINDIVLYKLTDSRYVLHRVRKISGESCITRGDNRISTEKVSVNSIIGRVTAIYRGEKELPVNCLKYKTYVLVHNLLYPLRWVRIKLKQHKQDN